MSKVYRTAMGKVVDVERLLLTNDQTIAMGNMRVNARGDELGRGGKVVKTKDQVMKEYYALNTPTAVDLPLEPLKASAAVADQPVAINPNSGMDEVDTGPETAPTTKPAKQMRGSLANSVAKK